MQVGKYACNAITVQNNKNRKRIEVLQLKKPKCYRWQQSTLHQQTGC
jgi:hypothetical protein